MKNNKLLKIVSLIFICALLLSAVTIVAFAQEEQETVEIYRKNITFGEKIQLMFAVKAPEDVQISANCGEQQITLEYIGTEVIDGEECRVYRTFEGWAAQNINSVVTVTATAGESTDKLSYSVLMYLYERLNLDGLDPVEEAKRITMYETLLAYAKASDEVVNAQDGRVPNELGKYHYVSVVGGTLDGYNEWGMFKEGETPLANVQHSLELAEDETDRWSYSVDGVAMGGISLGKLKSLVISGDTVVTVKADKAHKCIGEVCDPVSNFDELAEAAQQGGMYYLTNDIALPDGITFTADTTLCLNGNVLSHSGDEIFTMFTVNEGVTLNLVDCGETERVGYIDPTTLLWTEGVYGGEEEVTVITLTGGLITKGTGAGGRAILSSGTLNTVGINFAGNISTGEGAAINSSGTYTDNGSVFVGNTSSNQGATLRVSRKTTLDGTKFIGNSSTENRGGAILASGSSSKLEATGCYFDGNTASTQGGAVALSGITDVTFTECTFTNNSASRAGALYITSGANATTISCLFDGNSSDLGGAISTATEASYSDGVEGQTDKGSTFKNNSSTDEAGAVHSYCETRFYGTKFENNAATTTGGAIHTSSACTLYNCTFTSNTANNGGAISSSSAVNLNNCTFTSNTATTNGGAIYLVDEKTSATIKDNGSSFTSNTAKKGGAIYTSKGGAINLEGTIFTSNTASSDGGALYQYNSQKTNTMVNVTLTENRSNNNGVLYIGGVGETYIEGMKATGNYSKGYAMIYATSAGNTLYVNSAEVSGNTYSSTNKTGFIQSGNATAHIYVYKPGFTSEGLQGEAITNWDSLIVPKNSSTALDLIELEEPVALPTIE